MTSIGEFAVSPTGSSITDTNIWPSKPDRPCDACRKRKSRCVINTGRGTCVLCEFHHQACTFEEQPAPRKRKAAGTTTETGPGQKRISLNVQSQRDSNSNIRTNSLVEDYADLQGESLLKTTLGLQNHRHATYIGATSQYDTTILNLRLYDNVRAESAADQGSFRKVNSTDYFFQRADSDSPNHASDIEDLDTIESLVAPYGEALINLYFRIIHPSFPILHKKVYLEKYARSHQEFVPSLLAAVYILALNWWSYSTQLSKSKKPNIEQLELIAHRSLQSAAHRPKLSVVQAGLLLLQNPNQASPWSLTAQLVAMGQDLGLHRDCSQWRIPTWERGLRKRLAWALFMQSTWASLIHGRPIQFPPSSREWAVQAVISEDFPETAADEDEEDGSTEVEKGRTLFCAMIALTKMLAEVLDSLYSIQAEHDINCASSRIKFVLDRVKPIQLKLRQWYAEVPECLKLENNSRVGKLSSVGWLHSSYLAIEITLHRAIVRSLSFNADPYLTQVCRSAAKDRLKNALDFFGRLRAEHIQSFWYFASSFNFALFGVFAGICLVTSMTPEEAEFFRKSLQEYRWSLRVSSKGAEFLEKATHILESAVRSVLMKPIEINDGQLWSSSIYHSSFGEDDTFDVFLAEHGSHWHSMTGEY